MSDFRSDPMPSIEGRGLAKQTWEKYVQTSNKLLGPAVETVFGKAIQSVSANTVSDMVGFWLLWHIYGGFEGMRKLGMSRSSIFRKVATFRKLFGSHPDEFQFPGIHLDLEEFFDLTGKN